MDELYLVAGLGNPGSEYAHTRHNAGFMALEEFGRRFEAKWNEEPRFQSKVAQVRVARAKVLLCEPQTFMNSSGEAIVPLARFYKTSNLLVVVDDADLPFGQIRLRPAGSSGGHHGLESIEKHLGSSSFARLRIGIGRTEKQVREITGHVLGRFGAEEKPLLNKVLDRVAGQIECYLTGGLQKAMSQFNGAIETPEKKEEK